MKNSRRHLLSSIFFCIILLQNSASAQTAAPEPTPENNQSGELNLIHQGDLIDVDVIGSTEYDWRGKLNPEGFLDGIDFVEAPIYGLCQSEEAVAEAVGKAYGRILREPKVSVRILDRSNRPLSLLYGAVKIPYRLQIKRPVLLNELLILSGGLTDKASGTIQIYRPPGANCQRADEKNIDTAAQENRERFMLASQENAANYINIRIIDLLRGKKESNPQILSGDVITVLESELIYVTGGVANPKPIASREQMTLSRAIDSAGGIVKGGDSKKVTIFRRESGESKMIEADLDKIRNREADDIILKPYDIVEVAVRGADKNKVSPILKTSDALKTNTSNFPLRIID